MVRNVNIKRIIAVAFIAVIAFLSGAGASRLDPENGTASAQSIHPCLYRVNVPFNEMHWLYVAESADELYTEEQFFFLAGQLINEGVVDASFCPTGGMRDIDYANACGMATALPAVIEIQNSVNEAVLRAWREVGVPPVLLKQMIRRESQFWPSTHTKDEMDYLLEFGFGHMTYFRMQNALMWNRDLYAKICSTSTNVNCRQEEGIVNQFLYSLVATCDGCKNGIDPNQVDYSVDILAESVLGHCYQTSQLIYNATDWYPSLVVDYATIWKLTLVNYTSGPNCVYDAVSETFDQTDGPMSWAEISSNISDGNCEYGMYYANTITERYFDFPPD